MATNGTTHPLAPPMREFPYRSVARGHMLLRRHLAWPLAAALATEMHHHARDRQPTRDQLVERVAHGAATAALRLEGAQTAHAASEDDGAISGRLAGHAGTL